MKLALAEKIWITVILGLFSQASAVAAPVTIQLSFEPDLSNGRNVYEVCAACHLPEGWGNTDGGYPQIAGQHQNVLIQQLLEIRSGVRDNPIMYPFVQERTIGGYQSLVDVVMYISTLPMHPRHRKGPWNDLSDEYQQGRKLYQTLCSGCHGTEAEGNNTLLAPRLHGQHFPYIERQIKQIKYGHRRVNQSMKAVFDQQSAENLMLIANYVSHIPVPGDKLAPSASWRNPDFYGQDLLNND